MPGTSRELLKILGPSIDPKRQGSYYKDTHKKGPQCIETAIRATVTFVDSEQKLGS